MPPELLPASSPAAGRRRLVWVGVIGTLFLAVGGIGSAAAADAPGDGSAPDQYQEDIPTSTGSKPTDGDGAAAGGGSGGSSSGGDDSSGGTDSAGAGSSGGKDRSGGRDDSTAGRDPGAGGWSAYAPLEGKQVAVGPPESSGGVSSVLSEVGEGSAPVLALVILALLLPLAALAASAARSRRRRI
jgi:hypothetical protein